MPYEPALFDGSDPLYAPGAGWSGRWCYWKPTPKFRKLGYPVSSVRLPGEKDDGRDAERAREARRLTREMLAFYGADVPEMEAGTWGWLIHRYRNDRHSPIHGVKANTRKNYDWCLDRWDAAIGHTRIQQTTYETICDLRDGMLNKGRSVAYVHRMFNRLRAVTSYGVLIEDPAATKVSVVLSKMRFQAPPKRSVAPTREQVRSIIDEADARGMFAFATGILIQWTFALRAVDVRGQWLPCDPAAGGIVRELRRNRRQRNAPAGWERWQDGLTWDMIEDDVRGFTKVISKTVRSMPEPIRFDLSDAPEIRSRLTILRNRGQVGPLITSERNGLPYTSSGWTQAWARLRKDLDLPSNVWMMDSRAGAITEAKLLGADPYLLRDAAQHKNITTTDGYARGRSESVAKVVKLRSGKNG
jgi:hypothetical protein